MPETTLLIKAALNLRVGAVFDVYDNPHSGLVSINSCVLVYGICSTKLKLASCVV